MNFEEQIKPFFWVERADGASTCLYAGDYLEDVFATREEEGFEGGGYDWGSLAQVFLEERCKGEQKEAIRFDPEASMFCAYVSTAKGKELLKEFVLSFKEACEDRALILDLFSRAELD